MVCPNRNNDERIIAEVQRRKRISQQKEPKGQFEKMIFKGALNGILFSLPAERVQSVIKIDTDVWEVLLLSEQSVLSGETKITEIHQKIEQQQ